MINRKLVAAAFLAILAAVGIGRLAIAQQEQAKIVLAVGEVIDLDGTQATITSTFMNNPLNWTYGAEVSNSDGSVLAVLLLAVNGWRVDWKTRNPGDMFCATEERWMRAFARQAGFSATSFTIDRCKSNRLYSNQTSKGIYFESRGEMLMQWVGVKPKSARCAADAYMGTWQRPGTGGQSPQVQLVFRHSTSGRAYAEVRGFGRSPYGDRQAVLNRIYETDDSCRYEAQCTVTNIGTNPCTIVVDPVRDTLTVQGGDVFAVSDVPWTRTAPAAASPVCTARDIDGDWHRSDGAIVPMVGIDAGFRDGGNALMFNHPDNWPKGTHKFLRVFRNGGPESCNLSAVCISYDINRSTGQTFRRERNCTLTVDPKRQTMTESGSSLHYSRTPRGGQPARSITAPPAEPPVSVPVTSAQELAEIAKREQLNREQSEFAARQLAENEAAKKAFEQATAERAATIARQQAEHQAAVAAVEAERHRRERAYAEAMEKWRADVAACSAGDLTRCAPADKPR